MQIAAWHQYQDDDLASSLTLRRGSGRAREANRHGGADAGFDAHVGKPLEMSALKIEIELSIVKVASPRVACKPVAPSELETCDTRFVLYLMRDALVTPAERPLSSGPIGLRIGLLRVGGGRQRRATIGQERLLAKDCFQQVPRTALISETCIRLLELAFPLGRRQGLSRRRLRPRPGIRTHLHDRAS
jgi:hypothetical protein